jgi:septal ring factor EnvC (AmiA/AmiB activator)
MGETERRLQQEIDTLQQTEGYRRCRGCTVWQGKRCNELPEELARRDRRPEKIQQAKAELEQEAAEKPKQRAEAEAKRAARRQQEQQTGKKGGPPPGPGHAQARHAHKLRTAAGRVIYKMRKAVVEPIFGQINEQRGFRRFSVRGPDKVRAEWKLV